MQYSTSFFHLVFGINILYREFFNIKAETKLDLSIKKQLNVLRHIFLMLKSTLILVVQERTPYKSFVYHKNKLADYTINIL